MVPTTVGTCLCVSEFDFAQIKVEHVVKESVKAIVYVHAAKIAV